MSQECGFCVNGLALGLQMESLLDYIGHHYSYLSVGVAGHDYDHDLGLHLFGTD